MLKHSGPIIAVATWESSKINCGDSEAAFLTLHCIIKYAIQMENLGLNIEPTGDENDP